MSNKIIEKRLISFGLRSIILFIVGTTLLICFSLFLISYDIFIAFIFILVCCWLFISLLFFSFSTIIFKKEYLKVRGDFALSNSQIQKKTIIYYYGIKEFYITNLKEHTNTRGENLSFSYKYGNERFIIYGQNTLKCIEIVLSDKIERIIINKFSKKQVSLILKIIENNVNFYNPLTTEIYKNK